MDTAKEWFYNANTGEEYERELTQEEIAANEATIANSPAVSSPE